MILDAQRWDLKWDIPYIPISNEVIRILRRPVRHHSRVLGPLGDTDTSIYVETSDERRCYASPSSDSEVLCLITACLLHTCPPSDWHPDSMPSSFFPPSHCAVSKSSRSDALTAFTQKPRNDNVAEENQSPDHVLVPTQPSLTGVSSHLTALNHSSESASATIRSPSQCCGLWGAAGAVVGLAKNNPRGGIDAESLDPLPVLLVQFGPLSSELGTTVPGFDRADARSGSSGAGYRTSAGAAASRVPPPAPRSEHLAFVLRRPHAPGGHLLRGHEAHQTDQNRRDFPCWIEGFRVEVRYAEA